MNATEILITISLAISGWTLLKVVKTSEDVAVIKQQLRDLPCHGKNGNCPKP